MHTSSKYYKTTYSIDKVMYLRKSMLNEERYITGLYDIMHALGQYCNKKLLAKEIYGTNGEWKRNKQ